MTETAPGDGQPLLEVEGLEVVLPHPRAAAPGALRRQLRRCEPGEILGIVGESGCGKSTLSRGAHAPAAAQRRDHGRPHRASASSDLARAERRGAARAARVASIAMIFQDPLTSLNPTFTIGTQMVDVQKAHRGQRRRERRGHAAARDRAARARSGIPDAAERLDDYPHQFSGGMRQRIMIAMALMLEPALLIADEPTSALDVTLEAQILELLQAAARRAHGTAIIFISHDLGVVAQICDRVVVMYAGPRRRGGRRGRRSSSGRATRTRRRCSPRSLRASAAASALATIPGRVPSLSALPPGCKFADRCPHVAATSTASASPR